VEEDSKISDEEASESDEDDYIDDLPDAALARMKNPARTSVSQEVYGIFNKKGNFDARVIEKSEAVQQKIKSRLLESFMFSNLDKKDLKVVIDAMEVKDFEEGKTIIKQGDDGAELFLVGEGLLQCFKEIKGKEDLYLRDYEHGDSFGELALLYNCPRAATIRAKTKSTLYSLDRDTFNLIVKESSQKRREKYEQILKKVSILNSVSAYERSQIADAIKEENFKKGDQIIKQGDEGSIFYMISEGEAIANRVFEPGEEEKEVMQYTPGDYFGELALLRNEPRAASVVATTELVVLKLDRLSFKRMIGPLENILRRNMEMYETVVEF